MCGIWMCDDMNAVADIKKAVFDLPPAQAVELIECLEDYRDAVMAARRSLAALDTDEDETGSVSNPHWP